MGAAAAITLSTSMDHSFLQIDLTPHLSRFQIHLEQLEQELSAPDLYDNPQRAQALVREHAKIKLALTNAGRIAAVEKNLKENEALVASQSDPELAEIAAQEIPSLQKESLSLRRQILAAILPADPNESRNTIVEIRAGTGGDEAALFAGDLFRMYSRYAESAGWKLDLMDASPSGAGGYREIIFQILGEDVYKQMRFESGVHRVQRVPATESQGRIHTSTATVAVLPEAEEVDLVLKPDDLRIEVCRASGPGGQGVNTTDSAVQIMHLPTGLIVRCQDGRSQLKNKEKALGILRSRLLQQKQDEEAAKYAAHRKKQVGTGDRNEKIRTYNFPQNRITDHRINYTVYNLPAFMNGDLSELLAELQAEDLTLKLKESETARTA
jgi:peptide chain release factor 1